MWEDFRLLVVVKTYPLPSRKYYELVCTAGVREDGSWVRLYPIDYRYRHYHQRYRKYQWIRVRARKRSGDPRPESYEPDPDTAIRPLGKPLGTAGNWAERRKFVLAQQTYDMCQLQRVSQTERSLAVVRPMEVHDLIVKRTSQDWKPQWIELFRQQRLFGPKQKPLEKIPYRFYYSYRCAASGCRGHKQSIVDWELGQLFRTMRQKYQSEEIAIDKVREKFLHKMCAPAIDTHFIVGTHHRFRTWLVLGVFWPKNPADS